MKFILKNWFQILVLLILILILNQLSTLNTLKTIHTDLYGGDGKTGISAEVVNGGNLILDDTNVIHSDIDSMKDRGVWGNPLHVTTY